MKNVMKIAGLSLFALCLATTSWAGGSSCSSEKAESVSEGSHCTMKSSNAAHEACTITANQTVYSFAVPSVECEKCIETIQKAALANKGIACAHVDLATHTAYIIADKKMSQKDIAKVITDAGYKNKFNGSGQKVQAEFAKAVAAGDKGVNCCAKGTKDKV